VPLVVKGIPDPTDRSDQTDQTDLMNAGTIQSSRVGTLSTGERRTPKNRGRIKWIGRAPLPGPPNQGHKQKD
ncbi:MAG TPA: hypothetical protein PLC40_20295, partial [Candidatus Hydrogenedentes bacterium]|nr:hypothetical protein [Candidatus Hydrogenedentota bacterium]